MIATETLIRAMATFRVAMGAALLAGPALTYYVFTSHPKSLRTWLKGTIVVSLLFLVYTLWWSWSLLSDPEVGGFVAAVEQLGAERFPPRA